MIVFVIFLHYLVPLKYLARRVATAPTMIPTINAIRVYFVSIFSDSLRLI